MVNGKNHAGHCESRTLMADFIQAALIRDGTYTDQRR
jgi:hypothetical protein